MAARDLSAVLPARADTEALICEVLGLDPGEVVPGALLREDLGFDSFDLTELVVALEKRFRIWIPDRSFDELLTVDDVVRVAQHAPPTLPRRVQTESS